MTIIRCSETECLYNTKAICQKTTIQLDKDKKNKDLDRWICWDCTWPLGQMGNSQEVMFEGSGRRTLNEMSEEVEKQKKPRKRKD
jgi:hypothetical protein